MVMIQNGTILTEEPLHTWRAQIYVHQQGWMFFRTSFAVCIGVTERADGGDERCFTLSTAPAAAQHALSSSLIFQTLQVRIRSDALPSLIGS